MDGLDWKTSFKENDGIIIEKMIETIKPDLYRIARAKLDNKEDIDDVVEEAIIEIYINYKSLKEIHYFKTWAIKILINKCNKFYREMKRQEKILYKYINENQIEKDFSIDNVEKRLDFEVLLKKLNSDERIVMILYFENNYSVSEIAEILNENINTIKSRLYRGKNKIGNNNNIKHILIVIISICVISTGVVFADEIIKLFTSLFSNTTEAFLMAEKNGYVQSLNTDFIYDKNIGVKVNAIILDDNKLNIAFIYDFKNSQNIEMVELNKYIIMNENDEIIYKFDINDPYQENVSKVKGLIKDKDLVKFDENTYTESIILESNLLENNKSLKMIITEIRYNINTKNIIETGNWKININVDEKFKKNNNIYYRIEDNRCINTSKIELTESLLKIDLELNIFLDKELLRKIDAIILKDSIGKKHNFKYSYIENSKMNISKLYLEYDIGLFSKNIEFFELFINDIKIKFYK